MSNADEYKQGLKTFCMLLTCEGNDENDGDVNEEELEVPQVAENLQHQKLNSHSKGSTAIQSVRLTDVSLFQNVIYVTFSFPLFCPGLPSVCRVSVTQCL